MAKKLVSTLALSILISGFCVPVATSQLKPTITFGWNTLDYGWPTVNSSYFLGKASPSNDGSLYQSLTVTLPECKMLVDRKLTPIDCIESLEAQSGNGDWVRGKIARHIPVRWQPTYEKIVDNAGNIVEFSDGEIDLSASTANNMITGGRGALWEFEGVTHAGGNKFLFNVDADAVAINGSIDWRQGSVSGKLYPVSIRETLDVGKSLNDTSVANYSVTDSGTCVQTSSRSYCMKVNAFPEDIRFRLTLKLDKVASSINSERWFVTRTANPILEIKETSSYRTMVLEAAPVVVQVPTIELPREKETVVAFVKSWLTTLGKVSPDLNSLIQKQADIFMDGSGYIEVANSAGSTKIFSGWEPFFRYGTIKQLTGWNFTNMGSTLSSPSLQLKLSECPKSKNFPGFVSSNSTAIEPGPPTFNASEQTLEYRVAAPHLMESGLKNYGTYSLFVSSEIAKCLWGGTLASGKATVSIVNDDGTSQVATSVFKNDPSGLYFAVSGFHYSTGSIRIRFENGGNASASLPQTPKPVLRTITCVKGKVIKKVTAVNPKCPSGYKKK
jgi:hypothetical protein